MAAYEPVIYPTWWDNGIGNCVGVSYESTGTSAGQFAALKGSVTLLPIGVSWNGIPYPSSNTVGQGMLIPWGKVFAIYEEQIS